MTEFDVVCLGEPLVEFNQTADGSFKQGFGGDTSNCAIAAARQGARVGYMSAVGEDAFGEALMALWRRERVDTRAVATNANASTGIYFVTHDDEGHHFSYYRAASAASQLGPADIDRRVITATRYLQVSGISQAVSASACDAVFHAIDVAKNVGVGVAYDTNLRATLWPLARARAVIHEAIGLCDIALPGLDDAQVLTGLHDPEDIADFYLARGPNLVALTLGLRGTFVATPKERRLIPAFPVTPVDATGAGDAFDGAFLAELAAGTEPFAAARYANAAAALSTTGYGAVSPLPTRAQVQELLQQVDSR